MLPKFALRGSLVASMVYEPHRVSASLHSAGCVSFSSVSPGITFPSRITACHSLLHFHLAGQVLLLVIHLVECHMGFSLEDKKLHRCTVAGLLVAESLMPGGGELYENPGALAASHCLCVIYLLTVD